MNYLILITEESKPVLVEVPQKPNPDWPKYEGDSKLWNDDWDEYQGALQKIVSDKSKHVRLKNIEDVKELEEYHHNTHILDWLEGNIGQTFPLPTGYKVSFECCGKGGQIGNSKAGFHCDRSGCIHKLAILSKLEEEKVVAPSEEVKQFDGSVQFELDFGIRRIRVNCPDEDDDIYIQVKADKQYAGLSLSLDEAEQLANYILGHIKNARITNP